MKRLNAFFVLAGLVLALTITTTPAEAGSYTVSKSDYRGLSSIGRKLGVDWLSIAKTNGIKPPYRIRVGQVLTIPEGESQPAVAQTEATPAKAPVATAEIPASPAGVRQWKKVGGDPLLPLRMRKAWHKAEELRLTSEQANRLAQFGLSESQIEQVRKDLAGGQCQATARPVGYPWDGMAMGRGNWNATENATGDSIMVWACPEQDDIQVDIAMGCGNVAWKRHAPKPVTPTPQEKKAGLECEMVGALWAQVGGHGESGSARFSCLVPVGDHWKVGPSVGMSGSRFGNGEWVEVSNFVGAGIEARGSDIAGLDAVEFVVLVGQGSARGYSTDGMVEKLKASGMDARLAIQLRKRFAISPQTGVTVRFMPWVDVPLTGASTDILWKGGKVGEERGRHVVVGAILRLEMDRADWNVKPELTLGVWHISDVQEPIGAKILLGVATKDDVWRIGAGVQFPNPHWIVEVEWNPGLGWLHANTQVATTALLAGSTPTEQYLGVKASKSAKTSQPTTATPAKAETQVKVKAEKSGSSPFGWAADIQTAAQSTSSGASGNGGHTTSLTSTPTGSSGSTVDAALGLFAG